MSYGRRNEPILGAAVAALFLMMFAAPATAQDDLCAECHETRSQVAESVHEFMDCMECHAGFDEAVHPEEEGLRVDCSKCHDEESEAFEGSIHGEMLRSGVIDGDGCDICHGDIHEAKSRDNPESTTFGVQLPETCGRCHSEPTRALELGIRLIQPIEAYKASVHARALAEGKDSATCNDCHDSHGILPASDHRSRVHHETVPETCGACHAEVAAVFAESVHGKAAAHGVRESPVCTDCHGEHRILEPQHEDSPVNATNVPKVTCERCHADLRLTEKFGMDVGKVPAYKDSYHGLASRAGSVTVANCSSCHGVHDILPSTDPRAHTNTGNLGETCGQCHPGAGQRFALGPVHYVASDKEYPVVYWVRTVYIWIIVLTIAGMLLHNFFDLYRKAKNPPPRPPEGLEPGRERMSRGFRLAHGLLMSSFIVLVYTGFALTYPEAWWAIPFTALDAAGGAMRGLIHRFAAVVILLSALVHVVHLIKDRSARRCIREMIPNREDWHEFKERLAYFAGRSSYPPKAPWLGYPEKLEYLAVVWGTLVMAASGFILWFENLALQWLPGWSTSLATVIHFYEAVLASLAIFVWHFYAVFFDPVVYPMDPAWLTGKSAPGREIERLSPDAEKIQEP